MVAPAAELEAGAAVGRLAVLVQAQIAFARDGHAQGSVAEHLDLHRTARRPGDALRGDTVADDPDLLQVQLPGEDHHVGILRIEAQGLGIGDVELGGNMHLHTDTAGIFYSGDVGGNDSRDSGGFGSVKGAVCLGDILVIQDDIEGQICLYVVFSTVADYLRKVGQGKIVRAVRAHVQVLHPEIHRIGSGLHRSGKGLEASGRGHYLESVSPAHLRR